MIFSSFKLKAASVMNPSCPLKLQTSRFGVTSGSCGKSFLFSSFNEQSHILKNYR